MCYYLNVQFQDQRVNLDKCSYTFFLVLQQPFSSLDHLMADVSRSHTDTPHSVGFLWTRDQPDTETSDSTQHLHETDTNAPGLIRTRNPSKRAAADLRFRPHGRWNRHEFRIGKWK